MNPFGGYPYEYYNSSPFGWYHPYYQQGPECLPCFAPPYYGQHQPSNLSAVDFKKAVPTHEQVIKLQQDSDSPRAKDVEASKKENKTDKKLVKKKVFPKILKNEQNIYLHPPKIVKHKVKYFDPTSAPAVTTAEYNLVLDLEEQIRRSKLLQSIPESAVNELQFPERSQNPFITFRYRRIKKKFKKYVMSYDENHVSSSSDSENVNFFQRQDSENQSQISSSESLRLKKKKEMEKQKKKQNQKLVGKGCRRNIRKKQSDSSYNLD